jgi:hypothetical protein
VSVEVRVGCPCPGQPHPDGDIVELREKLGLAAGTAVQRLIVEANAKHGMAEAQIAGSLAEAYLLFGVEAWSFVDEQGGKLPVTELTIRAKLLSDFALAAPIADVADDLYMAPVLLPLVERAKRLSPITPTDGSTSAPPTGRPMPRKRSKRSSTTTTPTGGTAKTSASLAGVSN